MTVEKQDIQFINYPLNHLTDENPKSTNIQGLNISLMNHQLTSLYHAELLENNNGFRIKYEENKYYSDYMNDYDVDNFRDFYTNFGVIGCKVGSGKSFVVLGIIIRNYLVNFNRYVSAERNRLCYSFKKMDTNNFTVPTNIIIVPHNLFNQWKKYILDYTNIDGIFIGTKTHFTPIQSLMSRYKELTQTKDDDENFMEKMEEMSELYDTLTHNKVYLVSGKQWNNFADCWKMNMSKKVSRIFIDEVHALNLPNSSTLKCNFMWFITSSVKDITQHRNYGFIRDCIDSYFNISEEYKKYLIIRNNDDYIDSSLKLPTPIETTIKCRSSVILSIFDGVLSAEVKEMLLAEDIQGVVGHLGISTVKESDIIGVLCSNLENELKNAKLMYETKQQMHYVSEQSKTEALNRAKDKILMIEEKINGVKQRINDSNMDPIMHIEIENPVITPCCNNKFELQSITNYYDFQAKKQRNVGCPLCRQKLDLNKLIYLGEFKNNETEEESTNNPPEWKSEEHTKIENLEHILQNKINLDKKILIFSEHEGNLNTISDAFKNAGRDNLTPVKGSINHITNVIEKFNSGEIPNLFLNAKHCGSGLNLQKTDIVIIMHKMSKDNIKQVIGRAQRIGREGQLQVYFLYTENE